MFSLGLTAGRDKDRERSTTTEIKMQISRYIISNFHHDILNMDVSTDLN